MLSRLRAEVDLGWKQVLEVVGDFSGDRISESGELKHSAGGGRGDGNRWIFTIACDLRAMYTKLETETIHSRSPA